MNVSGSGVSFSSRIGRTTFNSRGRITTRIAPGISYVTNLRPRRQGNTSGQPLTLRQLWPLIPWTLFVVMWIFIFLHLS